MMVMAFPALLIGALALAGLLAGIILLIAGLAGHRRGLWIGGLVTLVISLLVVLGMAGMGLTFYYARGRASVRPRPAPPVIATGRPVQRTVAGPLTAERARDLLALPPGAAVPPGGRVVGEVAVSGVGVGRRTWAILEVPEGFGALLDEHFDKAEWDGVAAAMASTDGPAPGLIEWTPELVEAPLCYRHTSAGPPGGQREVFICYDAPARRLYCVSRQSNP